MGVGGQHHAPAALPPEKTQYQLYRKLGRPQGRAGRVRKISFPPGFDPRTVQPVASRYTDCAIPARIDHAITIIMYTNNMYIKHIVFSLLILISIPLKTKRRPLYLKPQSVPSSKHFVSVIKTNQFML